MSLPRAPRRRRPLLLANGIIAAIGLFAGGAAEAHFKLVSPPSWMSQDAQGGPQKTPPCGDEAGGTATGMVTAVQPGQTVPVQVMATIAHPGWYRISLKQGASSTQTMTSLPDPPTLSMTGAQQCTPAFIDNPVWSPTQPVLADKLGIPAGSTATNIMQSGSNTFNVTIPPGATCTKASPCTLQVLMFMTDHPSGSCNYHHCADIMIASADGGATDGPGADAGGSRGTGGAAATGAGGAAAAGSGGHTGADAGAGGAAAGVGGASGTGGTTGEGGTTTTGEGGANGVAGKTGAAGSAGPGGSGGNTKTTDESSGGCNCHVGGNAGNASLSIGSVLLALAAAVRRRRQNRR